MNAPHEHHIAVRRTARYYTLGPESGAPHIWYVCHGYGQLAQRFIGNFEVVEGKDRLVVAPEALSRMYVQGSEGTVGASWMTREDRLTEIDDYVNYLDALHQKITAGADVSTTLLGFSQGTATVARWVRYGMVRPKRLVLWGGVLPPDIGLEEDVRTLESVRIIFVLGMSDTLVNRDILTEQRFLLSRHGLDSDLIEFNGGHRLDSRILRFLADVQEV